MSAVARLEKAWSSNFFVVDGLLEARSHQERAAILLMLPDAIIAARAEQLQDACREMGFVAGADFVDVRLSQQSCRRLPDGQLPRHVFDQLEYWRNGMMAIAGACHE